MIALYESFFFVNKDFVSTTVAVTITVTTTTNSNNKFRSQRKPKQIMIFADNSNNTVKRNTPMRHS